MNIAQQATAKRAAYSFLATLTAGEPVILTLDGRDMAVTVQETLTRPTGMGSWDNDARVKVGYGIGRWNTEVSASRIADGYAALRRP